MSLSLRNWILIAIMLILLAYTGGTLGFQKLRNHRAQIQANLTLKQKQLEILQLLEKEWLALNRYPTLPVIPQSLNASLENMARQLNIGEKLQLNPIPKPPLGMEGIRVRLNRLNLDEMFDILYFLENHKPVLLIEQWEIITLPSSALLRLSFRIFKQNPA